MDETTPPSPRKGPAVRFMVAVAALVVVAALASTCLVLFASSKEPVRTADPPASSPSPSIGGDVVGGTFPPADVTAVAVEFTESGVGFGRSDLASPTLTAAGVRCVPTPLETAMLTERAPDPVSMDRDISAVQALVGLDREIFNCLAQCMPTDSERWSGLDLAAARPCFDETVVAIVRQVGLPVTWQVMHTLLVGWPQVSFFCHQSGHKAGQVAFDELDVDLESAMLQVGDDCISGAVHGLLDAFGATVPSIAEFEVPVRACVALNSGQCADGVGHAAWTAYKEYGPASEACGLFQDQLFRFVCDGGVFMRQFEQNDLGMEFPDAENRADHQAWLQMVVDMCTTFREQNRRTLDEDPGLGCWSTSPYLLWMPVVVASRETGGDLRVLDMASILADIDAACGAMGPVGAPACRSEHGNYVAPTAGYDMALSEELCAMFPGQGQDGYELCQKKARDLIEFSSGAR